MEEIELINAFKQQKAKIITVTSKCGKLNLNHCREAKSLNPVQVWIINDSVQASVQLFQLHTQKPK